MATFITVEQKAAESLLIQNRQQTLRNREQLNAVQVQPRLQAVAASPLVVSRRRELPPLDELAAFRQFKKESLLLLHFDGTNNSTAFTDSGRYSLVVTPQGAVAISTADSKFGGACGLFDGGYLSIDNAVLAVGNTFTIEMWIKFDSYDDFGGTYPLVIFGSDANWGGLYINHDVPGWYPQWYNVGHDDSQTGYNFAYGEWHHLAIVCNAGTVSFYRNGEDNENYLYDQVAIESTDVYIGGNPFYEESFYGKVDELRIKNQVVYTSNFTPSARPFKG
jgi:hypothetical protein